LKSNMNGIYIVAARNTESISHLWEDELVGVYRLRDR
jgi:hypothetical protein